MIYVCNRVCVLFYLLLNNLFLHFHMNILGEFVLSSMLLIFHDLWFSCQLLFLFWKLICLLNEVVSVKYKCCTAFVRTLTKIYQIINCFVIVTGKFISTKILQHWFHWNGFSPVCSLKWYMFSPHVYHEDTHLGVTISM